MKFIRWGNLNPIKQDGYRCKTFHSPPAKFGLYAFPVGFVEKFLLGGFEFREDRFEWIKDKEGNLIHYEHPLYPVKYSNPNYYYLAKTDLTPYQQFSMRRNKEKILAEKYLAKLKRPNKFTHYGRIWTHFNPKEYSFIDKKKQWYLVEYDIFLKLLERRAKEDKDKLEKDGITWAKDDCEVFIEQIERRRKSNR